MATDIIARGMITEYKSGTNISFKENDDGSVTISASSDVSSEDTVARDAINNHKLDKNNPHNVTAEQVGLGNVDNTSDLDKPISTAVQTALDDKADKTVATTSVDGLLSAEDKGKLDSVNDTYALKSKYGDTTIDVGRKAGTTVGINSTAEGQDTTASGNYSHTEGYSTTASGNVSHAEGKGTTASNYCAHAEGYSTTVSGECAHAEGNKTTASGKNSHAEGSHLNPSGSALPDRTITISDVEYTISGSTAHGINSHAEGAQSFAYGFSSHAEGNKTTASGNYSHAEGSSTTASGMYSHAEGSSTTASGRYSHAEGTSTTASNDDSHAEGYKTTASGLYSHAEGFSTTASGSYSHAGGYYNADMAAGTAFVIGNGTSSTALSNAFSVMFNGTVKAKSTITASTTADYAEFFEWLDGNPNEEDRVGYFVTMDGDKIRIANADDDFILGVVSGEPFVLGNGDCDVWNGMFLRDEFRRTIYEPAPKIEEILDDDGNPTGEFKEIEGAFEGTRPKLNPEYDHTKTYISRFDRPEWAPIGMLGVLAVRHDGTAKVNGYVTVAEGGIATACDKNAENSYRVIKANTDSVVEIIFR